MHRIPEAALTIVQFLGRTEGTLDHFEVEAASRRGLWCTR